MTASIRRRLVACVVLLACMTLSFAGASAGEAAKVRIGTEGTYRPFSYFTAGGELIGFDVEIVKAICKAAGLDCEMVTMDFHGMVPALHERKIDAIAAGMPITAKRLKVVASTDRYRSSGKRFVSCKPSGFSDISPAALAGRILGTQAGTTDAAYFKALYPGSDIRLYKSMDDAYQDLSSGRLDLVLSQEGTGYGFISSPAGKGCGFVGPRLDDPKYSGEGVGIELRKSDTDLRAAFNAGIRKVLADGTYKAINARYFPFSVY